MKTKTCSKCKQTKDIGEFSKDKNSKDGLRSQCKSCVSESNKAYRQATKEEIAKRKKAWYQENKEEIAERRKAYRQENKEKIAEYQKEYQKAYYQENKEKIVERKKAYYQENKEEIAESRKAYRQENKEKIAEWMKAYRQENKEERNKQSNERYNSDPLFKLEKLYRSSLTKAFKSIGKKKNCNSLKTVGFKKWQEFADRLSKQFYDHPITGEKMTFENHGKGEGCWQIDHKIPLLTAKTEEDLIRLSHYTNLQPLWTIDHLKKTTSDINSY